MEELEIVHRDRQIFLDEFNHEKSTREYCITYDDIVSFVCAHWLRNVHDMNTSHGYVIDLVLAYSMPHSNIASESNPVTIFRKYGKSSPSVHFDERVIVHTVPHWDPSRELGFSDYPGEGSISCPWWTGIDIKLVVCVYVTGWICCCPCCCCYSGYQFLRK